MDLLHSWPVYPAPVVHWASHMATRLTAHNHPEEPGTAISGAGSEDCDHNTHVGSACDCLHPGQGHCECRAPQLSITGCTRALAQDHAGRDGARLAVAALAEPGSPQSE